MMDSVRKIDAALVAQSKRNILQNTEGVFEMRMKSAKGPLLFAACVLLLCAGILVGFHTGAIEVFSSLYRSTLWVIQEILQTNREAIVFFAITPVAVLAFLLMAGSRSIVYLKLDDQSIQYKKQWQYILGMKGTTISFDGWKNVRVGDLDFSKKMKLPIDVLAKDEIRHSVDVDFIVFGIPSVEECKKWLDAKKRDTLTTKTEGPFTPNVLADTVSAFEMQAISVDHWTHPAVSTLKALGTLAKYGVLVLTGILVISSGLIWVIMGEAPSLELVGKFFDFVQEQSNHSRVGYQLVQFGLLFITAPILVYVFQHTDVAYIRIDQHGLSTKTSRDVWLKRQGTTRALPASTPLVIEHIISAHPTLTIRTKDVGHQGFSLKLKQKTFGKEALTKFETWLRAHYTVENMNS